MSAAESPATPAVRRVDDLYRRHAPEVFRYAYAVLGNRADAEDVTQTTFVNALRALERGEEPRKPAHWLIVIAHNLVRQRWRHAATHPAEVELVGDVASPPVDDGPQLEELVHALQRIPPSQREALVMRELEGRPYTEIAELLGLTTGALETLLFRARRSLADELENLVTCERAELELTRRLDGRLGRKERRRLEEHLAGCPSCARRAQVYARQRRAFTGLAVLPLPIGATFAPGVAGVANASAGAGSGLATIGGGSVLGGGTAAVGASGGAVGGATGAGLLAGGVAKVAAVVVAGTIATGAAVSGAELTHRVPFARHDTGPPARSVPAPARPDTSTSGAGTVRGASADTRRADRPAKKASVGSGRRNAHASVPTTPAPKRARAERSAPTVPGKAAKSRTSPARGNKAPAVRPDARKSGSRSPASDPVRGRSDPPQTQPGPAGPGASPRSERTTDATAPGAADATGKSSAPLAPDPTAGVTPAEPAAAGHGKP